MMMMMMITMLGHNKGSNHCDVMDVIEGGSTHSPQPQSSLLMQVVELLFLHPPLIVIIAFIVLLVVARQ
jgi:hypothetical protein